MHQLLFGFERFRVRSARGTYELGPILKTSQFSGSMQKTHELVPIDIIVQFGQKVPDELPKKCHLCVECAKYGEKNGFQRPGVH